jgi:thiol:disulfide interchange protein
MKRSLFQLMGTTLLLGAMAVPGFCGAKRITWVNGYEAGLSQAKAQHKIAVMDFYTDSCGWCREMDKKTFADKSVIQMSEKFVMVKVNAMKDRTAMIRHEVRGFPTMLVLNEEGKELTRIPGFRRAEDLVSDMKEVLQTSKKSASR